MLDRENDETSELIRGSESKETQPPHQQVISWLPRLSEGKISVKDPSDIPTHDVKSDFDLSPTIIDAKALTSILNPSDNGDDEAVLSEETLLMTLEEELLEESKHQKVAVLLNSNARAVSKRLTERVGKLIPREDIYLSSSLEEAETYVKEILKSGYDRVITGGGDGSIMNTINMLQTWSQKTRRRMPRLGVLKLGTGNALASVLKASKPLQDLKKLKQSRDENVDIFEKTALNFVECDEGISAPFIGLGVEAQVVNDYEATKAKLKIGFLKRLFATVLGYAWSIAFVSLPKVLRAKERPQVKLTTRGIAYRRSGSIENPAWERVENDEVLYDGRALWVASGSIPVYGFKFKLLPFACAKEGFIHVRVLNTPLLNMVRNIWPKMWRGTWDHPELHDFLIQRVDVVADRMLDYQVGGDGMGQRSTISLSCTRSKVELIAMEQPSMIGQAVTSE